MTKIDLFKLIVENFIRWKIYLGLFSSPLEMNIPFVTSFTLFRMSLFIWLFVLFYALNMFGSGFQLELTLKMRVIVYFLIFFFKNV